MKVVAAIDSLVGDCGDRCSNIMHANLEGLEAGYNA